MRIARFVANGRIHTGTVAEDGTPLDASGHAYAAHEVTWLPPVEPPKVIGLALNYADHAAELNKVDLPDELAKPQAPALFFKPRTALTGNGAPIVYPTGANYMHYEGELAVVIGRSGRKVRQGDAMEYVKGYTIANDVTVRDFVQNFYRPPVKAKGFDSFGPLGPWMVTADAFGDPTNVTIRTFVNNELRQEGNTRNLIHTIPAIIEYIAAFMTLEENDVLLTGTPEGISAIHPGDIVRIEVDGIGALENPVVAEATENK
jgi:5-oxopent-3-ene-1,2,5-tricarboxylate decarboxylase/2-hydroxyhepta-2,4-diene-1,7-dioate isomerase